MSFGEVDTLNMLFDKLQSLFDESQGYYEQFLDTNNMYKQGKIGDKEFFQTLGDYTVAYSALEFLAIKVIFEIKNIQICYIQKEDLLNFIIFLLSLENLQFNLNAFG